MINSDDLKPIDDLISELHAVVDVTASVTGLEKTGAVAGMAIRLKALQDAKNAMVTAGMKQHEATHREWCPVCHSYHVDPGEKTDAGQLTKPCPASPKDAVWNQLPPRTTAEANANARRRQEVQCMACGAINGHTPTCPAN